MPNVGVDAVEKLAASRRVLEVRGEMGGDAGVGDNGVQKSESVVESEMVRCSPEVSNGAWRG